MKEHARNIIKNTLVGAVVGVMLSFMLPSFAHALSISAPDLGNPAWMSVFFGAISGATTAIQPVFDWAFRDKSKDASLSAPPQKEKEAPAPARETANLVEFCQADSIRMATMTQETDGFSAVAAERQRRASLSSGTEPTLP